MGEKMGMFKKDFIIGLDIGTSSIKIAQFAKKEDGLHLMKVDLKEIKPIEDESLREKEIVSILKYLFREIDIKKSKIIASINCPKTAIKIAKAPYMPKAELRDGINLEAKNYFPFPIDEALLDFEILGEVVEKGVKKYQLLVATAPQKTVDEYISLLSKVGIKPSSFIPVACALQKIIENSHPKKDEVKAVLEVGERFAELAIFAGGELLFSRKIPIAGGDLTKAMTGVLVSDRGKTGLSLEEAEKIKREVGIPAEGESKIIEEKISTRQILSMIRPQLEQLANEIDRCFDYYREESGGSTVDSLMLFGGGATLQGLPEFLSKELGIEVKLGNPLEGLKINPGAINEQDKVTHRLSSAIGASLNEAKGINLLPIEIKEETKRTFERATIQGVATACILILAFIYIGMRIQLTNFQKRISVTKMELSSLQLQLKQVKLQDFANALLADEPYWEDVFKELSNIVPDDVYLTGFSMKNTVITMEGVIVSEEKEEVLSDFIQALEKGIFRNVKLVKIEDIEEKKSSEFEINCWID